MTISMREKVSGRRRIIGIATLLVASLFATSISASAAVPTASKKGVAKGSIKFFMPVGETDLCSYFSVTSVTLAKGSNVYSATVTSQSSSKNANVPDSTDKRAYCTATWKASDVPAGKYTIAYTVTCVQPLGCDPSMWWVGKKETKTLNKKKGIKKFTASKSYAHITANLEGSPQTMVFTVKKKIKVKKKRTVKQSRFVLSADPAKLPLG